MSTKPPASVVASPADSLEKLSYSIVADIPTEEFNDRNRLGYCLWGWLSERHGTLLQADSCGGSTQLACTRSNVRNHPKKT